MTERLNWTEEERDASVTCKLTRKRSPEGTVTGGRLQTRKQPDSLAS